MGDDRGLPIEETPEHREMDFRSSSDTAVADADHLVVMVHGILGSTDDWKFAANQFVRAFSNKVVVHCSECNMHSLTLDGIDVMGERLADEITKLVNQKKNLRKISIIAHSVGGLVARYAIGQLYTPKRKATKDVSGSVERTNGTIHGLEAVNFITVATPHLGSRGNKQVPFLFGVPAIEKLATCIIHWIFRRTGSHLFLTDSDEGKLPLLLRMVDDGGGLFFMTALHAFRRRVVYSNACYDHIVGRRTSSIRRNSELPKWEDSLNKRYPHIVYEEYSKEVYVEKTAPFSMANCNTDQIEEELVTGLSRVSWQRVDVSFHSCKQKRSAHSVIQVKDHSVHFEGADVIQHMIDQFLN